MKIHRLIFLALFVSISSFCMAQVDSITEEVKKNLTARVSNGVNTGIVVGLISSEGTAYFSCGVKSLKTNEAVDENTVFEIGSISKTFTGVLLADMVEKGDLSLEDPLQTLLPEGVIAPTRNEASIKLYQMSNHTSSLPGMPSNFTPANFANPYADYSEEQLYAFLNAYELTRDIGSKYEYSNYAAGLLGHVLAAKRKVTYEELMMEVIAKPLGMENTSIALSPPMKENLAMGHSYGAEVENWDIPTLAGAGAIRSTAVDMLKYLAANMGIEKNSLYPAMQLSHKNSRTEGSSPAVGLGWHTMVRNKQEIIWHNGGTGGYATFTGFIKGGDVGVVVLSNSNVSVDDIGVHLLHPASALNEPKPSNEAIPPTIAEKEVIVEDAILERYVGKYELVPGFVITITKNGKQMSAQATGQSAFGIYPKSENTFYLKAIDAQIVFNKNDAGEVESLTLLQGGQETTGVKL